MGHHHSKEHHEHHHKVHLVRGSGQRREGDLPSWVSKSEFKPKASSCSGPGHSLTACSPSKKIKEQRLEA